MKVCGFESLRGFSFYLYLQFKFDLIQILLRFNAIFKIRELRQHWFQYFNEKEL